MFYTYILRCEDNSLYTGITTDVERRMKEHFDKTSRCAKYTRTHTAKKLEAVWQSENKILASRLEFYIKRLTKEQKENLILTANLQILSGKIEKERYINVINSMC